MSNPDLTATDADKRWQEGFDAGYRTAAAEGRCLDCAERANLTAEKARQVVPSSVRITGSTRPPDRRWGAEQ